MKINLEALKRAGWHVYSSEHDGSVLELVPPPMSAGDHEQLKTVIKKHCDTAMGLDLVLGELYSAMARAAILEVIEN